MTGFGKENKWLLLPLITGAVYLCLRYLTPLITPILTAMLFVTLFGPLLQKMQRRLHIHRQVGAAILLLLVGAVAAALVWVFFYWIGNSIPRWLEGLGTLEQELAEWIRHSGNLVGRLTGMDGDYLEKWLTDQVSAVFRHFKEQGVPVVLSQSLGYVRSLGLFGAFLVTFLIAAILLARDYDDIMNRLLDTEAFHVPLEVICGLIRSIATYVRAQLTIMSMVAAVAAVALGVAGVRHGVLWGILAGILDALPFIGTGVVLMPLTLTHLFQGRYGVAAVCLTLYGACILLRQSMEPRLIGRRMGVHPVAVLVSLYAGIRLFGGWGIVKGPFGLVLVCQIYRSVSRRQEELTSDGR